MLDEMFDLDQALPNIAKHNVRCPDKVCKLSNIMSDQMLDQLLDRFYRALQGGFCDICDS